MQKGSLVRIKESGDPKLVGTYGLVVRFVLPRGFIMIQRVVDGCRDSYHYTKLELIV